MAVRRATTVTTHRAPAVGTGVTSCCGRNPFDLPPNDRVTVSLAFADCHPWMETGGLPPDLSEFIGRYIPAHPDAVPVAVRVGPVTEYALRAGHCQYQPPNLPATLFGLRIEQGGDLPPGVWQLLAADGSLLRDSRSTNEVPR